MYKKEFMRLVQSTIWLFCFLVIIASCKNGAESEKADAKVGTTEAVTKTDTLKFTMNEVDNLKDPTCGMPLGAGIEDTAHYKNKIIGFCSKECKEDFLKNAAGKNVTVEWKK